MTYRPLIGLNADYRAAAHNQPAFSYVAAGYYDAIAAAGGIPVVVPPLEDDSMLAAIMDRVDGFVLIGGADLDPRNDGFMLHASVKPLEARRERFDRRLMHELFDLSNVAFQCSVSALVCNC